MFADTINLDDFILDISNFKKNEKVFVEIQEEGQYNPIIKQIKYNIQPMCLNRTLFPHDKKTDDASQNEESRTMQYLDAALKTIAIDSIHSGNDFAFLEKVMYRDGESVYLIFNAHLYKIDQFKTWKDGNNYYIQSSSSAHLIMKDLQLTRVYLFVDLAACNPDLPVYASPPTNEFFFGYQIMEFNKIIYELRKLNPNADISLCSELNSQYMKKFEYSLNYLHNFLKGKVQNQEENYLNCVYEKEYKLKEIMDETQAKRLIDQIEEERRLQQNFIKGFCVSPNYLTTLCLAFKCAKEKDMDYVWQLFRVVYDCEHRIKKQRCRDKFGDKLDTVMKDYIFGDWQKEYADDAFLFGKAKWIYLIDTVNKIPFDKCEK